MVMLDFLGVERIYHIGECEEIANMMNFFGVERTSSVWGMDKEPR